MDCVTVACMFFVLEAEILAFIHCLFIFCLSLFYVSVLPGCMHVTTNPGTLVNLKPQNHKTPLTLCTWKVNKWVHLEEKVGRKIYMVFCSYQIDCPLGLVFDLVICKL